MIDSKHYKDLVNAKGYTLIEVSDMLGVSRAVVCNGINNSQKNKVGEKTLKLITEAIDSLPNKKYVEDDLNNWFIKAYLKGIMIKEIAKESGYSKEHISKIKCGRVKAEYQTKEDIIEAITKMINERFG